MIAEAVLVVALAASALWQVWSWSPATVEGGRPVHAVLVAASTLPLLARRSSATLVLAVVVVATTVQYALGGGLGQPFFAVGMALYSIGAHAPAPQTFLGPAVIALQVLGPGRASASTRRPSGRGRARLVRPGRPLGVRALDPAPTG